MLCNGMMMNTKTKTAPIPPTWMSMNFWKSEDWINLQDELEASCDGEHWSPAKYDILRPFALTPLKKTKVVFLNSKPPKGNISDGLAFSTRGKLISQETLRLFDEMRRDLGGYSPHHGNLDQWATEGVLLLNSVLVSESKTGKAIQEEVWDNLIYEVLFELSNVNPELVVVTFGTRAYDLCVDLGLEYMVNRLFAYSDVLDHEAKNGIHNSQLFSRVNTALESSKLRKINWSLPGCHQPTIKKPPVG